MKYDLTFEHDEDDCNGTRCAACGCCMHSDHCLLDDMCPNDDCGCAWIQLHEARAASHALGLVIVLALTGLIVAGLIGAVLVIA